MARLKMDPVGVVRFSKPRIRRNNARNATALHPSSMRPRAVVICGTRRGQSSCMPSATLEGTLHAYVSASCFSRRSKIWMIGGAGSIGVGSTRFSAPSLRSVEPDDIVMKRPLRLVSLFFFCAMTWGGWIAGAEGYGVNGVVFGAAAASVALGGCT